jgi:hypothetical protein
LSRMHATLSGRITALPSFSVAAGCGLLEPDEGEWVMPGRLADSASAFWFQAPDVVRVGEEFQIIVRTQGGCRGRYITTVPYATEVAVAGLLVDVRPYDLVRRHPRPEEGCVDALHLLPHEVTVTPTAAGTLTIRAVGRWLRPGEAHTRRGLTVVRERTVEVVP